jgi:hypothetical protein
LLHWFLRDNAAFATGQGSAGLVERQEKFGALPLAFLPQGKRLLYGVLFRVEPSALNRAAGEGLLVRGTVYRQSQVLGIRCQREVSGGRYQVSVIRCQAPARTKGQEASDRGRVPLVSERHYK